MLGPKQRYEEFKNQLKILMLRLKSQGKDILNINNLKLRNYLINIGIKELV